MPRPCHADHPLRPRACRLCRWCVDRSETGAWHRRLWDEPEPPPARQIVPAVDGTGNGIGDAVLATTTAEGLRHDDPARPVYFVARPWTVEWVRLFWPDDLVLTEPLPGVPELRPHDTYGAQNAERLRRPRWEHYASACGTHARLPQPRPLSEEALAWAEPYKGCVILAPWSGYQRPGAPPWAPNSRVWLRSHWLHLERLLNDRGRRTVIIDDATERNAPFRGDKLIGQSPQRVAALMRASACVVANDSGMAHVAGALGVAAVAICAQVRGEQVFGIYPRVRALQGPLGCSGCHWSGPHWRPACEELCASLQAVQPEEVLAAVEERISGPLDLLVRQHSLLDSARLAALAAAVRATVALDGAMAEAGTYRGGSALLIASAAPGKTLHVFDALGIPEDDAAVGGVHRHGEFAGSPEQLRRLLAGHDVRFHFGVFPQTASEVPPGERFSLVHLDLDTLQSTRAALEYFWPRLVPGGLIVLDDVDWPACPGVRQALAEVLPSVPVETPAPYQGLVRKPR